MTEEEKTAAWEVLLGIPTEEELAEMEFITRADIDEALRQVERDLAILHQGAINPVGACACSRRYR